MASIRKRGQSYRVELYKDGQRESASFPTKREASAWALEREAELSGAELPDKTLGDALERYRREVSPLHKGERWEAIRLLKLEAGKLARKRLSAVTKDDMATWRNDRMAEVGPASVAREMALIRSVFAACCNDWGWLRVSPMAGLTKPPQPPSRKRRITGPEVARIELATGLGEGLTAETAMNRTGLAFLFALETAMRAGEILGMMWPDVAEKSVTLPRTKNGDERRVPLSKRAREILALLPRTDGTVFNLQPGTRDALWRRAVKATGIENLHFHDARAEAIWRLSKKLDVMELARVIGHRDLKSLLLYYQTDADELADRL